MLWFSGSQRPAPRGPAKSARQCVCVGPVAVHLAQLLLSGLLTRPQTLGSWAWGTARGHGQRPRVPGAAGDCQPQEAPPASGCQGSLLWSYVFSPSHPFPFARDSVFTAHSQVRVSWGARLVPSLERVTLVLTVVSGGPC